MLFIVFVFRLINTDEGEPGTFKDRLIVERDPHSILEGVIIAAYAVGAHRAFVYIRGEFFLGVKRWIKAISDAYQHGLLIDYGMYIQKIIDYLFQSYTITKSDVSVELNISSIYLDIDKAVPCSLIINEMISNSLKHAFPKGRKGAITIDMSVDENSFHLRYVDNGIGLPDDQILEKNHSLGFQLIKGLTIQLGGELEIIREGGTCYLIVFPK